LEIKINAEIAKYWPPLEADKFAILEKSIKDEGLRDPLVVWKQTNELLDGNHRKRILDKHKKSYGDKIKYLSFPSLLHAKRWVHLNQQGRRGAEFKFLGCCHIIELREFYDEAARGRQSGAGGDKKSEAYKSLSPLEGLSDSAEGRAVEQMARDVPCGKNYLERVLYIKKYDLKRFKKLEAYAHTSADAEKEISVDAERAKAKVMRESKEKGLNISEKAIDMLISRRTVNAFCAAVEKTKADSEIQKRVAEYIATDESEGIHDLATGEKEERTEMFVKLILDEKDGKEDLQREEKDDLKKFEAFIRECADDINAVTEKIDTLIEFKKEFDSEIYQDRIERLFFENAIDSFLEKISQLRSKKNDRKD